MKHLLLISTILFAVASRSQNVTLPYDSVTGAIIYKQITEIPLSKEEGVFSNAGRWLDKKYGAAVDTVLEMDEEQGRIVVRATVEEAVTLSGTEHKVYLEHLVTINAKDNKCMAQISDLKCKEYFEATEYSSAGWKEVPLEGIVLGVMNNRFGDANSQAYKKFLLAEDVTVKTVLDSFDAFMLQADAAQASKDR